MGASNSLGYRVSGREGGLIAQMGKQDSKDETFCSGLMGSK